VQDRRDGGAARGDRDIDADALEQPVVGAFADPRDDAGNPQLPAEQAGKEIALVVIDHRDQHVAATDVLAFQQLEISAAAIQDQRVRETLRQQLGARPAVLNQRQLDTIRLVFQALRQLQADIAPADDRDALPVWFGGPGHPTAHVL
jgi:hypothetical protein